MELIGEDGYALAEGRGGTYGSMSLRIGSRWAWNAPGAASQRETETRQDFGTQNMSLSSELTRVVDAWLGDEHSAPVHPATMAEGRAVTELCDRLYQQLARARTR